MAGGQIGGLLCQVEIPRQQGLEVVSSACVGKTVEGSFEPEVALDAMGLGRFYERANDRAGVGDPGSVVIEPGAKLVQYGFAVRLACHRLGRGVHPLEKIFFQVKLENGN